MKKFFQLAMLLLLSGALANCGNKDNQVLLPVAFEYSGENFLSGPEALTRLTNSNLFALTAKPGRSPI